MKKDSVVKHVKHCHTHGQFCKDLEAESVISVMCEGGIATGFQKGQESEEVRVKRIMTECFYIAKKDHSLNSLSSRCDLTSYLLDESLGTSYINGDMARDFISCVASVVRGDMILDISQSEWFSLMLDESYDKGWRAQLLSTMRYVKDGIICTRFYSINELRPRTLEIQGKTKKVTAGSAPSCAYAIKD